MVAVLLTVCAISSAALAFTYNNTKDLIAEAKEKKSMAAVKEVLIPDFDNFPSKDVFDIVANDGKAMQCYPAKKGDKLTSVAVRSVSNKGYSGDIVLMVGFLPNGEINKISVVGQSETPGLGTLIAMPKFTSQFEGKNPANFNLKVKKDGGDVDAVTAATISSRAFCDAVDQAYKSFVKHGVK